MKGKRRGEDEWEKEGRKDGRAGRGRKEQQREREGRCGGGISRSRREAGKGRGGGEPAAKLLTASGKAVVPSSSALEAVPGPGRELSADSVPSVGG